MKISKTAVSKHVPHKLNLFERHKTLLSRTVSASQMTLLVDLKKGDPTQSVIGKYVRSQWECLKRCSVALRPAYIMSIFAIFSAQ